MIGMILVRYSSDVGLKRNSGGHHFLTRVQRRIRQGLKDRGIIFDMVEGHGHILLYTEDIERSCAVLKRTFGVGSFSLCLISLDDTDDSAVESCIQTMIPFLKDKTFRVSCNRIDSPHKSRMTEEREWGARFFPHAKGVNLKNPEVNVRMEILRGKTHFFLIKKDGPGGLGFSTKERVLVLISGGFDSAVAAWKMMKKGINCDYLFFNMGGVVYERMALEVVKVLNDLWAKNTGARFFSMDFNGVILEIKKKIENPYRQIVLKRLMYRAAEKMVKKERSMGMVTGESIGQVSSQSLTNLCFIQAATHCPVFRPLLNDDKNEIIALAKKISTANLSEKIVELCGISRGQPVVRPKMGKLLQEEKKLEMSPLLASFDHMNRWEVDNITTNDLKAPYLFVEHFPNDAHIIDCQDSHMFRSWHMPKAQHILPERLIENPALLEKGKNHVLYCTYGTKTPYLAELLQSKGREAYAFRGGVPQIKKMLEGINKQT